MEHIGKAHDDHLGGAPVIPGQHAQRDADERLYQHGQKADLQRDAPAVDEPGEHVAARGVRAQGMRGAGRAEELVGDGVGLQVQHQRQHHQ